MGQLELSPPTVLSSSVTQFSKGVANSNIKAKANTHLPGATEPPLPLTPQRLKLIMAYAENALRSTDGVTESRIAQRFAPRALGAPTSGDLRPAAPMPPTAPLSGLASGIRMLTAVLVVAALLPNLTLAAFWLGLIDMPWSKTVAGQPSENLLSAVQPAVPPPVLSAPNALEASAGDDIDFPVALDGTDGVPARSTIVVRGLPRGSALSNGYPHGKTEWRLEPDEIGDLHLVLPNAANGESKITIQLVAPGDRIIADASTILNVVPAPMAIGGAVAIETELGEAQVSDQQVQELEVGVEERTAPLEAAPLDSDPVPLPTRRPTTAGSQDSRTNSVMPSAFVNLREGPSSSASVVDVVAKGTKLRVTGRKRGWVQVTNPATSHTGWIYAGNVKTVP